MSSIKAEKIKEVAKPITLADESEIRDQIGCGLGSIGPAIKIPMTWIGAPRALRTSSQDANEDDYPFKKFELGEGCEDIRGLWILEEVKEG